MEINVSGHKMNVGEALTEHAQDRLITISEKYFTQSIDAKTTFTKSGHLFHVDISLHPLGGINLQARADADDPYAAFEGAAERVEKQLRRYKRRLKNHHNLAGRDVAGALGNMSVLAAQADDSGQTDAEESATNGQAAVPDQPMIIAEAETQIPTVSVSDAVMLMDFSGAEALMFTNVKTGGHEVVFHRRDGNIGWIRPKA